MKVCGVLPIAVVALMVLTGSLLRAQPDRIVLDSSKVPGKKQRPAVMFPHNRHIEIELPCKDCHHFYQDGKNILDESKLEEGNQDIRCSACHGPRSRLNLQEAFHDQCMGCHKRYQKENKKTGPRYCGGCHIRIIK